jgi:hypothetical protein
MESNATELLMVLALLAGVVAGIVAGLRKWTILSPRVVAAVTMVFGIVVGVLVHYTGIFGVLSGADEPKGVILAGAWGLLASIAGKGFTTASALDVFKKPQE